MANPVPFVFLSISSSVIPLMVLSNDTNFRCSIINWAENTSSFFCRLSLLTFFKFLIISAIISLFYVLFYTIMALLVKSG